MGIGSRFAAKAAAKASAKAATKAEREAAERAADWPVPEDDVRSDIEAALRSQGIEPLARGVRA